MAWRRAFRLAGVGRVVVWGALLGALAGCQPQANVVGYWFSRWLGTQPPPVSVAAPGALAGAVYTSGGQPIAGATVLVAQPDGVPHATQTGPDGSYQLAGVPPGEYVPAAVAPGYAESALSGLLGLPKLIVVHSQETAVVPPLVLAPYQPAPLPADLAAAVQLRQTGFYTAAADFPARAAADVRSYAFDYVGATVDTVRLYLPRGQAVEQRLPLLLMVYPSPVDNWETVSVGFAAEHFAVLAISPVAARGVDAEAHAQDARVVLAAAQQGAFPAVDASRVLALGGSFSSAILARLLRSAGGELTGWVTVGGLANAFSAAHDFYTARITIPPPYTWLVPALGPPNLYPLAFLMYSPVYVAEELPPTLVIHTAADEILRIEQAYELTQAVQAAGIAVTTHYYEDASHYLGIGENLTDAGREMFYAIVEFARQTGGNP